MDNCLAHPDIHKPEVTKCKFSETREVFHNCGDLNGFKNRSGWYFDDLYE